MYDFKLSGRGEIVLTDTGQARSSLAVVSPESSRLLVLTKEADSVVAEVEAPKNRRVKVALPPGNYLVYLLSPDELKSAPAELIAGQEKFLADAEFKTRNLDRAIAKGGLFRQAFEHRLGLSMVLRRMPLEAASYALGASLAYRLRMHSDSRLQPVLRLQWTQAPDAGLSTGYFDLGVLAGIGYVLPLGGIQLRAEILAGYEHMFQDDLDGSSRNSSGFSYLGLLGLEIPVGSFVFNLDLGGGGRVFQVRDQDWVHRLDLQFSLGIGWKWGG
jgi:hypothetical protein